jgi:hypothetical protein
MRGHHERRCSLVVDKAMQRKLITGVSVIPTLALTAMMILVAGYCRRLMAEAEQAEIVLPSLMPLLACVLVFAVVMGLVVLVRALRFSHRIAGPAYRMMRTLERVEQGDVSVRVGLRDGDYLVELADALNRHLDWLESRVTAAASATEPAPASVAEPAPASVAEPAPASVAEPAPASVAEPAPEPEPVGRA